MADRLKVSCNNMDKDIQTLEQEIKNLSKDIENLQVAMRSLSRSWSGPAWSEYMTNFTSDLEKMSEMYQVLIKIQKSMSVGCGEYLKAEFDNKVSLSTVMIG